MALREYIQALQEHFPDLVERVILFGSKARGESRKSSDVDIVVATKKRVSLKKWEKMVGLTINPLLKYEVKISPRIMPQEKLNQWSPFIANVKRDAVPLWFQKKYKNLLLK